MSYQEPSLRLVPAKVPIKASISDTANSLVWPRSLADEIKSTNPLQARLENWDESQRNLKLTMHRNIYGLHAPMRQLMERKIVSRDPHIPAMPQSNIHLEILEGRDETLDVTDFFNFEAGPSMDIHADMERKLRM
ncbi:proteasome maturation factor UMP1 [Multifurca ochricompacta]|uniref:Proteasome maturation factor UMP1 n=1 Tax=Multifurca ochricompacta TaxID=376703 RepID=A0AAD4MBU2_9AGAM|nr:proteasome maturation factor UMP1 [Multifurca ochricompacta]